ncbi:hypothetical protein, partial [Pseudomonas sp. Pseusp97]|uniref:hypothetical protein n=1 Tax=Pseudomonas sp. Pseusp97 TaxID=3243065 RepID=UPI0039A58AA3
SRARLNLDGARWPANRSSAPCKSVPPQARSYEKQKSKNPAAMRAFFMSEEGSGQQCRAHNASGVIRHRGG